MSPRSFYATLTIRPDVPLLVSLRNAWQEALDPLKDAQGLTFALTYLPLTKALLVNSQKSGGNAKDIDPEDGPLLVVLLNPTWESPADDDRVYRGVEGLLARFRALAEEKGRLHRYIFTNYAYYKEDVFRGYGERSLARLRETSREVDPDGVFQKAVSGSFKLGVEG